MGPYCILPPIFRAFFTINCVVLGGGGLPCIFGNLWMQSCACTTSHWPRRTRFGSWIWRSHGAATRGGGGRFAMPITWGHCGTCTTFSPWRRSTTTGLFISAVFDNDNGIILGCSSIPATSGLYLHRRGHCVVTTTPWWWWWQEVIISCLFISGQLLLLLLIMFQPVWLVSFLWMSRITITIATSWI